MGAVVGVAAVADAPPGTASGRWAATTAEWHVAAGANGKGTPQQPFGSIQDALGAARPGDTIVVHPGRYLGPLRTVRDGRPDSPVTVQSANGRGTVVVAAEGEVLQVDHAHVVVDGLVFDGQYGPGDTLDVNSGAHAFVLRNSEVRRSGRDCLDLAGPDDVLVEGSSIHHCLDATNGRSDAHGIVAGGVRRLTIRDCQIHTFSGDAFQVDPGRTVDGWDEVTIERTETWLAPLAQPENGFAAGVVPGENAIDTKAAVAAPRARLVVRDVVAWGFRGGLITNMAAFNLKENVTATIDRVTVRDSEIAFRLRGPAGSRGGAWVTVSNAVVHSVATAVRYEDNLENFRLWNSTIGREVGRAFHGAASKASRLDVRNLLVVGPALPLEASGGSNMAVDVSAFVGAATHDYHLVSGSAPEDAGIAIDAVTTDRDGYRRPQGRAPDIGAYESRGKPRG